jgi:hypothetical protein
MSVNPTFNMSFGPIQLAWHLDQDDPEWQEFLAAYRAYEGEGPGDFRINARTMPIDPANPQPVLPNSFMWGRRIDGPNFDLGDGLIRGTLTDETACECDIHPTLLHDCGLRVLEQFFYLLFQQTVTRKFGRNEQTPFLLHCSAAATDSGAMVFCGPSGAGKSTIAANCPPGTILTDECAIIQPQATGAIVTGSPVNPFCTFKTPGTHRLQTLYTISHGQSNTIAPADTFSIIPRLTAEIMVPLGLMETDMGLAMTRAMDAALRLKQMIAVKELGFLPNNTFWDLVVEDSAGQAK